MIPTFSVVVPVRNEADNILSLVEEIHAAMSGRYAFEILYVDDGSTDETPSRLREAALRFPMLKSLRHRESCGQSSALWTGAQAARGRWIVTLDGDGQNDPADIPALAEIALAAERDGESRLTLVAGIRRRRHDTLSKRLTSRAGNAIRRACLKDQVSDTGCGLKIMRRDAFLRLPFFNHMHRYFAALLLRDGGCLRCVDVNHRPRQHGVSNYGFFDRLWVGMSDLFGVAWLIRRMTHPVIEPEEGSVPGSAPIPESSALRQPGQET